MALRSIISSPLEAGTSILDAHHLPSAYHPVFEYTSKRLSRKGLHITLVVTRRDSQVSSQAIGDEAAATTSEDPVVTTTPPQTPDVVPWTPGFSTFKSLVRSKTQHHSSSSAGEPDFKAPKRSKTMASLPKKPSLASLLDGGPGSPRRLRWPLSPSTPATPRTPATPASATTASSTTTYSVGGSPEALSPDFRLMHTAALTTRAGRVVTATLDRATRKFHLSTPLIAHDPSAHRIPSDVMHRSILQNELLFSSEGLTVLSLDHLYTFKSALAHYASFMSEPGNDFRLEDAVDELRRYVLSSSGGRRRLLKSALVGSYEWLGPVNDAALDAVMKMYCRAYGGVTKDTGIENDLFRRQGDPIRSAAPTPPPKDDTRFERDDTSALPCLPVPREISSPVNWPLSSDTRIPENLPAMAEEGTASKPETPVVKEGIHTPTHTLAPGDSLAETDSDKTPTKPNDGDKLQDTTTIETPPEILLQRPKAIYSPRASPKAALPTLKLQTSFPSAPSKRKMTPMPGAFRKKAPTEGGSSTSGGTEGDIKIEIAPDDDGDITDFEDGDLTARPPPTATRTSASFWVGGSIDEMLNSRQQQRGSTGTGSLSPRAHHRRSLSWGQSPQRLGPVTPNGADDLSPITRGEWGFLMVSDPFKTRTAAVETC